METILNLFSFAQATWGSLVVRFFVELLLTVLVVWLAGVIMLQITKKKDHSIGFTNWFKYCLLWAINIAVAILGVVAVLTIRSNGLFYFSAGSLSFSLYCGYLLMLPEILLLIGWVVTFWMINKSIKESI